MIRRILCQIFGHRWHAGFWETRCERCRTVEVDRLYQRGLGVGPEGKEVQKT